MSLAAVPRRRAETVHALARFHLRNSATSSLRVVEIELARGPGWVRPAQLALGLGVGTVLVAARRWIAVPMAGIGVRLLLDPGTHHYYSAGMGLMVLLWELARAPERVPWRSVVTVAVLELTATWVPLHSLAGPLRLAVLLTIVVMSFLPPAVASENQLVDEHAPASPSPATAGTRPV